MSEDYSVIDGFSEMQRDAVVRLFWAAFKGKLNLVMKPEAKALTFFEMVADPAHAICVLASDGTLIGVAGFKTKRGRFIGGGHDQSLLLGSSFSRRCFFNAILL